MEQKSKPTKRHDFLLDNYCNFVLGSIQRSRKVSNWIAMNNRSVQNSCSALKTSLKFWVRQLSYIAMRGWGKDEAENTGKAPTGRNLIPAFINLGWNNESYYLPKGTKYSHLLYAYTFALCANYSSTVEWNLKLCSTWPVQTRVVCNIHCQK